MSREADLARLKELKQDLYDVYEMAERCEFLSSKINGFLKEKQESPKLDYKIEPVNNYEKLKKEYDEKWVKRHNNLTFYKVILFIVSALAMSAVVIMLYKDLFLNAGGVVSPEMMAQVENHYGKISILVSQIVLSLIFLIAPMTLFGKES